MTSPIVSSPTSILIFCISISLLVILDIIVSSSSDVPIIFCNASMLPNIPDASFGGVIKVLLPIRLFILSIDKNRPVGSISVAL